MKAQASILRDLQEGRKWWKLSCRQIADQSSISVKLNDFSRLVGDYEEERWKTIVKDKR